MRALWEFARRNVDQPSQLRALVRQLEGIGADDEASVATQEDAAEKANKERENAIRILISSLKKYNATEQNIINELMSNFSITKVEAQGYLNQSSKQS